MGEKFGLPTGLKYHCNVAAQGILKAAWLSGMLKLLRLQLLTIQGGVIENWYPSGGTLIVFVTGQLPPLPGFTVTLYTPGVNIVIDCVVAPVLHK